MSFSAHADAKGIMQLIGNCQPEHVMFVHGEAAKMEFLKGKVEKEFKIPVHMPANGETVVIPAQPKLDIRVPLEVHINSKDASIYNFFQKIDRSLSLDPNPSKAECPFVAEFAFDMEVVSSLFISVIFRTSEREPQHCDYCRF